MNSAEPVIHVSIAKRIKTCPCFFYTGLVLLIFAITLLAGALGSNEDWKAFGCLISGILLVISTGFMIACYSFAEERAPRMINEHFTEALDRSVPKHIEQRLHGKTQSYESKENESYDDRDEQPRLSVKNSRKVVEMPRIDENAVDFGMEL